MDTIGRRRLDDMTLSELLTRKAIDYGYGTTTNMARVLGLNPERLNGPMRGTHEIGIQTRRIIVRELDVDPDVLDQVAQRNIDKLKARYPEGFDPERSIHRDM